MNSRTTKDTNSATRKTAFATYGKLSLVAALLLAGPVGAVAQHNETGDCDKTVRRITFDREQVTIVYADGTTDTDVQEATIRYTPEATGIGTLTRSASPAAVYSLSGQQVAAAQAADSRLPKGIYIVREGNKVRKTVKR